MNYKTLPQTPKSKNTCLNGGRPRESNVSKQGALQVPTLYPTEQEFEDPIRYISSIKQLGAKYGMVKIIPPASFSNDFQIQPKDFKFQVRLQQLNKLHGACRIAENYCERLIKFHGQTTGESVSETMVELNDGRCYPIDYFKLKNIVYSYTKGFYQDSCLNWTRVANDYGTISKNSYLLKNVFVKFVLPFESFLAAGLYKAAKHDPKTVGKVNSDGSEDSFVLQRRQENHLEENYSHFNICETKKMKMMPKKQDLVQEECIRSHGGLCGDLEDQKIRKSPRLCFRSSNDYCLTNSNLNPLKASHKKKKVCQSCKKDLNISSNLKCDDCGESYHERCTSQFQNHIVSEYWSCDACISSSIVDYGFEDGKKRSISSFHRLATNFKESYFPGLVPNEEEIESEFWRLISCPFDDVVVEYAADLHSSDVGSGFPTKEKDPLNPKSHHPWNLTNIATIPGSILGNLEKSVPGMTVPWLYVGMMFSAFCWHAEDHYTYSINYHHWGETKTWYCIPARHAKKLENTMQSAFPELFDSNKDLMFHITTLISPNELKSAGVDVYCANQRQGEFIVTWPEAYHAGFNHGLNCAEAVNFAPQDWLPYGLECAKKYSILYKEPVFSHDELVISTAKRVLLGKEESSIFLVEALKTLVADEVCYRKNVLKYCGMKEEDFGFHHDKKRGITDKSCEQCAECSAYCALSCVFSSRSGKPFCLKHVDQCIQEARRVDGILFEFRHTIQDLETLVQDVEAKKFIRKRTRYSDP